MSKNRIEQVIDFIRAHPELSGNQIYLYSVAHGFGIKKQRYYQIYRQEKIQPKTKPIPKTKPKVKKIIKKIIPKKRIVRKKIIKEKPKLTEKYKLLSEKLTDLIEYPEDEYEYGLIEVYDKNKKESFWIKYQDKAHLDWQIDKLEASGKRKGYTPDYDFIYHGMRSYTPFITPEFEAIMNQVGEGD